MQPSLSEEIRRYPYFMQPVIDALRQPGADPQLRAYLKQRLAVNISSSPALRELLALDSESLSDFYGEGHDTPSTLDTIDTFLTHFCHPAPGAPPADITGLPASIPGIPSTPMTSPERYDPETQLPPAPAVDFLAELEESAPTIVTGETDETAPDSTSSCIDAFLKAQPAKRPRPRRTLGNDAHAQPADDISDIPAIPSTPPFDVGQTVETDYMEDHSDEEIADDPTYSETTSEKASTSPSSSTLTEGFARILIKNGNFSKALEIITQLNLKNPEKSIYFADQIRFLRKLIANQEKS